MLLFLYFDEGEFIYIY